MVDVINLQAQLDVVICLVISADLSDRKTNLGAIEAARNLIGFY